MARLPSIARARLRSRFTIGSLMVVIGLIAVILTALRPLAGMIGSAYPALAEQILVLATPETGIILSCFVIGVFITIKLMAYDESGS